MKLINELEIFYIVTKILPQSIKVPSLDTLNFPHNNDFCLWSIIVWCDLNLCKFYFACSDLVDYVWKFRYTSHSASLGFKSRVANLSCVQAKIFLFFCQMLLSIAQMVAIHNSWSFLSCGTSMYCKYILQNFHMIRSVRGYFWNNLSVFSNHKIRKSIGNFARNWNS